MSAAASAQASATMSHDSVSPMTSGCGAASRAPTIAGPCFNSVMRTRPAISSNTSVSPAIDRPWHWPSRARTKAVPTLGWPANGISARGVKMRTWAVCSRFCGGRTKGVSARLNSVAMACICGALSARASGKTASGLPPNWRSVNTSTVKNSSCMARAPAAHVWGKLLQRQGRHRDIHRAGGIRDHAHGLVVISDAGEAQIVDGEVGGDAVALGDEARDGRGDALLGVGGERFQVDHRLVGENFLQIRRRRLRRGAEQAEGGLRLHVERHVGKTQDLPVLVEHRPAVELPRGAGAEKAEQAALLDVDQKRYQEAIARGGDGGILHGHGERAAAVFGKRLAAELCL